MSKFLCEYMLSFLTEVNLLGHTVTLFNAWDIPAFSRLPFSVLTRSGRVQLLLTSEAPALPSYVVAVIWWQHIMFFDCDALCQKYFSFLAINLLGVSSELLTLKYEVRFFSYFDWK